MNIQHKNKDYSLDKTIVNESVKRLLTELKKSILRPKKPLDKDLKLFQTKSADNKLYTALPIIEHEKHSDAFLSVNQLLIAGAGSGKTTQIVNHIKFLSVRLRLSDYFARLSLI